MGSTQPLLVQECSGLAVRGKLDRSSTSSQIETFLIILSDRKEYLKLLVDPLELRSAPTSRMAGVRYGKTAVIAPTNSAQISQGIFKYARKDQRRRTEAHELPARYSAETTSSSRQCSSVLSPSKCRHSHGHRVDEQRG
jgi:hypothetical protein